jgi:hypothetical protein
MVFVAGNITGGTLNIFPIHNFGNSDHTPGQGVDLEKALAFFLQGLTTDFYKAGIIRAHFEADLSQVRRRKPSHFSFPIQIAHVYFTPKRFFVPLYLLIYSSYNPMASSEITFSRRNESAHDY